MKNTFKIVGVLFFSIISLSSCSSDDSGDSLGTTTGNYFPMAVNNKWDYTDGATPTEMRLIGTTAFGGTTYYEMDDTNSALVAQSWVAKKGASYYQKVGTTTQVQGTTTVVIEPYEMKILKDDLAVGESWQGSASPKVDYSGPSGSGSFRAGISYEGTVTARDASETLGSITYTNIIKVEMEAVVNSNGQINTITTEFWFAKDIGLIKEVEHSTVDNVTNMRYLTGHTLN